MDELCNWMTVFELCSSHQWCGSGFFIFYAELLKSEWEESPVVRHLFIYCQRFPLGAKSACITYYRLKYYTWTGTLIFQNRLLFALINHFLLMFDKYPFTDCNMNIHKDCISLVDNCNKKKAKRKSIIPKAMKPSPSMPGTSKLQCCSGCWIEADALNLPSNPPDQSVQPLLMTTMVSTFAQACTVVHKQS